MAKNLAETDYCILCCNGGSCVKNGAQEVTRELRARLRVQGLHPQVHTIITRCMGQCREGIR